MYQEYNCNPIARRGDDCVIRAISKVMNRCWEDVYSELCLYGLDAYDVPSANHVWGKYLKDKGWTRHIIPNTCPQCYTVEQFCEDHPKGKYLLALDGHLVAVVDGDYFDSWDSGNEIPIYYWKKGM